jgi:hypothetical protein
MTWHINNVASESHGNKIPKHWAPRPNTKITHPQPAHQVNTDEKQDARNPDASRDLQLSSFQRQKK